MKYSLKLISMYDRFLNTINVILVSRKYMSNQPLQISLPPHYPKRE